VRAALIGSAALIALAAPAAVAQSPAAEPLTVKAVYSSVIEEPWDGVIHAALEAEVAASRITHTYQDGIGYDGQMEFVLQEVASEGPDIIFGDSFGNEEAVRRVAAQFPDIPFVFGSGAGPAEPNFSVFDNWIHEPAYLAGMLAGGLTESNTIGVVAGFPVPEVNRITNAFIQGATTQNPDAKVVVTFINSWFDPATAKEAAVAQIGQGADVLYAERAGVIEAAIEAGIPVVGNMADQQELGPENVVTSVMWNMTPTVEYVVDQVLAGAYTSQDLKDFTMMAKGGADLAPINPALNVPADLAAAVEAKKADILSGLFRVDINESQPAGSTIVGQ
jgi:basic membrane lipoprotein Med (substrate-binding protein (PBP1-ABC) superfamily)